MSTKDLVNAMIDGNANEIESAFNTAMMEKIANRLDSMRIDVAKTLFTKEAFMGSSNAKKYSGSFSARPHGHGKKIDDEDKDVKPKSKKFIPPRFVDSYKKD
jgi:hypothetical protein